MATNSKSVHTAQLSLMFKTGGKIRFIYIVCMILVRHLKCFTLIGWRAHMISFIYQIIGGMEPHEPQIVGGSPKWQNLVTASLTINLQSSLRYLLLLVLINECICLKISIFRFNIRENFWIHLDEGLGWTPSCKTVT